MLFKYLNDIARICSARKELKVILSCSFKFSSLTEEDLEFTHPLNYFFETFVNASTVILLVCRYHLLILVR